ncbi:MAG: DivIVA domain-containing protein [Acidimicrobiia bacterium]
MDLTAIDVQQKTFRERFRGFDPDEVEDFLERVVETLRGYELKLRDQNDSLEALRQDLAGTKEAEEAIKRTYITAQRTSKEMVVEAQEKASRVLDKAKGEAEGMVSAARADVKRTRDDAATEHESLQRRVAQLRTAVSDLQGRLKQFADGAAVELEGLGASIDLETHSISEILEAVDRKSETGSGSGQAKVQEPTQPQADPEQAEAEPETAVEAPKAEGHDAAYLQQPRGQRPWERA